jgi:hypothetical protein
MTTPDINLEELSQAPQASSVRIFYCANPRCMRPHVVLFDDLDGIIAHFVLPYRRTDGGSFAHDLVEALESAESGASGHA